MKTYAIPPLSLYIHFPWCVQKCPYCDFNSHKVVDQFQEQAYLDCLLKELDNNETLLRERNIDTVFMGGGTPSLFSPSSIAAVLNHLFDITQHRPREITLEANPGTADAGHFSGYLDAGVNRLSLGVQSFADAQLIKLGRIHDSQQAIQAYQTARCCGFRNINLDLMHGLSGQTTKGALMDLEQAIELAPDHLSWYQLTLEPNTYFARFPPSLPDDDAIWEMHLAGTELLAKNGYEQYEVSAFSQHNKTCQHNLNYWLFNDYLGIGAGAHSKLTHSERIKRHWNEKHPKRYMNSNIATIAGEATVGDKQVLFEYMMNRLRLASPINEDELFEATHRRIGDLEPTLSNLVHKKLIHPNKESIILTSRGRSLLNDVIMAWL